MTDKYEEARKSLDKVFDHLHAVAHGFVETALGNLEAAAGEAINRAEAKENHPSNATPDREQMIEDIAVARGAGDERLAEGWRKVGNKMPDELLVLLWRNLPREGRRAKTNPKADAPDGSGIMDGLFSTLRDFTGGEKGGKEEKSPYDDVKPATEEDRSNDEGRGRWADGDSD